MSKISFVVPLSILTFFALSAAPAALATSANNCTLINCNLHDVTIPFGILGLNPCNNQAISTEAFVTGNVAFHGSADGSHMTGTVTGQLTFTQDNGVTYTGHISDWFGGNINKGAAEMSGTTNAKLTGSDGTFFHLNADTHITITASGDITANVNNFRCH